MGQDKAPQLKKDDNAGRSLFPLLRRNTMT